jgi:hypothetical protein
MRRTVAVLCCSCLTIRDEMMDESNCTWAILLATSSCDKIAITDSYIAMRCICK